MTLRPNSIVQSIIYDDATQRATGVRVLDAETKEELEFKARIIFCCASTVASTSILLNSKSDRFPNGLGNDSGELGHNLMDHHFRSGAVGVLDAYNDKYYKGRRPNGIYLTRFRNLDKRTEHKEFLRGYAYQGSASRQNWSRAIKEFGIGPQVKDAMMAPGPWQMGLGGFGETLPYHENHMYLNYEKLDKFGMPTVVFDAEWKENELKMREDMKTSAAEMLEAAGFKNVQDIRGGQFSRIGDSRNGYCANGTRSRDFRPESIQPGTQRSECLCDRWIIHGFLGMSESIINVHGVYGPRCKSRGRRAKER